MAGLLTLLVCQEQPARVVPGGAAAATSSRGAAALNLKAMMKVESAGVLNGDSELGADRGSDPSKLDQILQILGAVNQRLDGLEQSVVDMIKGIATRQPQKEWYSTAELAELLGKSDFTVREKWCNQGRVECQKDPDSGKWRIPAQELHRLRNGGSLKPRHPR